MVVSEPQKPIAKKKEYFGSRLHVTDKSEKIPSKKLPMTFTIKMFIGKPPITKEDSTILYLKIAPSVAPTPNKTNSNPFKTRIVLYIMR